MLRDLCRLAAAAAKAGGCKSPLMKLRRGDKALTSDSPRAADPERCHGDNRVPASLSIALATNGGVGWVVVGGGGLLFLFLQNSEPGDGGISARSPSVVRFLHLKQLKVIFLSPLDCRVNTKHPMSCEE